MNCTVQSWTWTIWQYLPNPVISPRLTIPGCYSVFEKDTCVLKKYKVSPYFNMKALWGRKNLSVQTPKRDGENVREVDVISHTQWEQACSCEEFCPDLRSRQLDCVWLLLPNTFRQCKLSHSSKDKGGYQNMLNCKFFVDLSCAQMRFKCWPSLSEVRTCRIVSVLPSSTQTVDVKEVSGLRCYPRNFPLARLLDWVIFFPQKG